MTDYAKLAGENLTLHSDQPCIVRVLSVEQEKMLAEIRDGKLVVCEWVECSPGKPTFAEATNPMTLIWPQCEYTGPGTAPTHYLRGLTPPKDVT